MLLQALILVAGPHALHTCLNGSFGCPAARRMPRPAWRCCCGCWLGLSNGARCGGLPLSVCSSCSGEPYDALERLQPCEHTEGSALR